MSLSSLQRPTVRFYILLGIQLCWGFFLWQSISLYGLGTSRDSAEYLFASLNLWRGHGFISFSGQPYILWPPLYPILLAIIQGLGAANPLNAAVVLQLITFGLLSCLIASLFSRLFFRNFFLAFMGSAIAGTGAALTILFPGVGSDYLFIVLILSMAYLCDEYMVNNRLQTVWLMALVSALAMLQRYIGITVLMTSALIVYFHSRMTLRERLVRVALLGLSVIPIGTWVLSISLESLERGGPSGLVENIYWFTVSALSWFFSFSTLLAHPVRLQMGLWVIWLLAMLCALVFLTIRKRDVGATRTEVPLLFFGLIYTIVLLTISSLSYFNRLDGRFVSPVFIPFIILLLVAVEAVLDVKRLRNTMIQTAGRVVAFSVLLLVLGLSAYQSVIFIRQSHAEGSGYTSREWYANRTIQYWLQHQPDGEYLVFSNYPAGVAIHSWREILPSPRRASPNSRIDEIIYPLDDYIPLLFDDGKDSYLIWIEPNLFTHIYLVDELRQIANIEVLYEDADGGIYKLLPLR
jgi:hypothetical protein